MALWGVPNTQSSIWGTDLRLGSRNWSRAHTELGEFHDRKKWTPMDHPLKREPKLREMQNHPRRAAYFAEQKLENESKNLVKGKPADGDPDDNVVSNEGLADLSHAKMLANQIDAARGRHKQRVAESHQIFVENFDAWLRGNGRPEEYERAGMHDLAAKARKLAANGGTGKGAILTLTPISKHPTVNQYLGKKVSRKIDYELEIAKRRLRQGRTGPPGRELTIREAWELYKYGVHGLDPQGYHVDPNTGLPDASESPEQPLIEEIENEYDDTPEVKKQWTQGSPGKPPAPAPDPYVAQLPEVPVVINPQLQQVIDAHPAQAEEGALEAEDAEEFGEVDAEEEEEEESDELSETPAASPSRVEQTAAAVTPAPSAKGKEHAPTPESWPGEDEAAELEERLSAHQRKEFHKRMTASPKKDFVTQVAILKDILGPPAAQPTATIAVDKSTLPAAQTVGGAPVTGETPAEQLREKRAAAIEARAPPPPTQEPPSTPTKPPPAPSTPTTATPFPSAIPGSGPSTPRGPPPLPPTPKTAEDYAQQEDRALKQAEDLFARATSSPAGSKQRMLYAKQAELMAKVAAQYAGLRRSTRTTKGIPAPKLSP